MRTLEHGIAMTWTLAVCCLLACGGDDTGDAPQGGQAGGGAGAAGTAMPTDLGCMPGELQVRGTLAGAAVEERMESGTHAFINKIGDGPGTLEVMAGEVSLRLWFDQLLGNGRSTAARGQFSNASVDAGNCESGESPGRLDMDSDGDGVSFVLNELHAPPYCQGAPVAGTLAGCFRFPPSLFP